MLIMTYSIFENIILKIPCVHVTYSQEILRITPLNRPTVVAMRKIRKMSNIYWNTPNQASCSPWISMASPKSASFTAAPLALLASSKFSGWNAPAKFTEGPCVSRIIVNKFTTVASMCIRSYVAMKSWKKSFWSEQRSALRPVLFIYILIFIG